jgi:hypothetical protein
MATASKELERCPKCDTIAERTHCENQKKPRRNKRCPWWDCIPCGYRWKREPGYMQVPR